MDPERQDAANGSARYDTSPSSEQNRHVNKIHRPLPAWKNIIKNFSPVWFSISMNTNILAIIMHQLPYQFKALHILSAIMYVFGLVLFVIFAVLTLLRWSMFPKATARAHATSLEELCFLGAPPIAFLTLTALTSIIVSSAYWGGHAWSVVAYVMWWFGTAWMFATAMGVTITLFRTQLVHDRTLTPALFLPVVGLATDAVVGASICNFSYEFSPRLAVPIIITAYLLAGLAIWFSIIVYSLYFHRLLAVGYPNGAQIPTMFMLVGPFGQTGSAMLLLSSAVQRNMNFAAYNKGVFISSISASSIASASVVMALLLIGHDIFWLMCAVCAVGEATFRGQTSYSMAWWATIFPVGTITLGFLELSIVMDSPTFSILCTTFLIILLLDYFINWAFTIGYSFHGDILIKRDEYTEKED